MSRGACHNRNSARSPRRVVKKRDWVLLSRVRHVPVYTALQMDLALRAACHAACVGFDLKHATFPGAIESSLGREILLHSRHPVLFGEHQRGLFISNPDGKDEITNNKLLKYRTSQVKLYELIGNDVVGQQKLNSYPAKFFAMKRSIFF